MPTISKRVREALLTRFSSSWASKLAARSGDYSVSGNDLNRLTTIDWNQSRLQVVSGGYQNPEDIEDTGVAVYPLVIFSGGDGAGSDNQTLFQRFSGTVPAQITFAFTWAKSKTLANAEEVMDLIEDVIVEVLHDPAWVNSIGAGISYGRQDLNFSRSALIQSGEHWRQTISARLTLGVDV